MIKMIRIAHSVVLHGRERLGFSLRATDHGTGTMNFEVCEM